MSTIVSMSGGMDSATVLSWVMARTTAIPVHFKYGSKHNVWEAKALAALLVHYALPVIVVDVSGVFAGFRSSLLKGQGEIPEGHYQAENMKQTVVPARNIIFTSILAGLAESLGADEIALGIHQGDHAIYPDCRPEFFLAMNSAVLAGTGDKVKLVAPFLDTNKEGILRYGMEREVPYALTRTCYKDQPLPCGKCGACQERLEAFAMVGGKDPVEYEQQ